jgi:hypothetical protein
MTKEICWNVLHGSGKKILYRNNTLSFIYTHTQKAALERETRADFNYKNTIKQQNIKEGKKTPHFTGLPIQHYSRTFNNTY